MKAPKQNLPFQDSINDLSQKALGRESSAVIQARQALADLLELDSRNSNYFFRILEKCQAWLPDRRLSRAAKCGTWIEEPSKIPPEGAVVFRPFTRSSPVTWYESLIPRTEELRKTARTLTVEISPMDGGRGSSVGRASHRAKHIRSSEDLTEGSKATDLFDFELGVSLAELRLLQAFAAAREGVFARVVIHALVGPETLRSSERLWKKACHLDPSKTYEEYAATLGNVERGETVVQAYNPTLDERNRLSTERLAPYGHGFFAQFGLEKAIEASEASAEPNSRCLRVIFNGEDEGGMPDELALAGIYESGIPITLFAVEKIPGVDKKGGLVGEKNSGTPQASVTVVDTAQAEASGQLEVFRNGEGIVSTNALVFNIDALARELRVGIEDLGYAALASDPSTLESVFTLGSEALARLATPDFIANAKIQDGREFIQPEGTISTALFNLNRFWVEQYRRPLVRVMAVGRENRTKFFLPIKFAIDHVEKSLRFKRDPATFRLIDPTPGHRPIFDLEGPAMNGKYYEDVENCWNTFKGSDMIHLGTLRVRGRVSFRNAMLAGDITVLSPSAWEVDVTPKLREAQVTFRQEHGGTLPSTTEIRVAEDGSIRVSCL